MKRTPRPLATLALSALAALSASPALAQAPALPDLSGRWAQVQVTTSAAQLPVLGAVTSQTTSLLLVDIAQDGERLDVSQRVCDIAITSDVKRVRTIVPRAFMSAASQKRPGRVWIQGESARFELPAFTTVLGASLSDETSEALPTQPDDSRVRDADRDGKPGVTVKVEGIVNGDLYVVQRGWSELSGPVQGDRLDGSIRWASQQTVLDSTHLLLGDSPTSRSTGDPSQNYFKSRRVSANTSCSALRRQARALFP